MVDLYPVLNYIYISLFKWKSCVFVCLRVCMCKCVWLPLHVHIYMPLSSLHIYVCFNARVGVWMSVCMSLCCHICCYQGNPVGRRRSAERCMAWRREKCGAQPVAGKKPVRDLSTNPVPFPFPRPWDELFPSRRDNQVDSSTEETEGRSLHEEALSAPSFSPAGGFTFSLSCFQI